MKVLWLAHAVPYPPRSGFLLRSYNLLKELATRHEVDLVAFVQEPWMRTLFGSVEEGLVESRRVLEGMCTRVTFLPIDTVTRPLGKQRTAVAALLSGGSYSMSWLVTARGRSTIAAHVNTGRYDLVHFDTIGLAPYLSSVAELPATVTHHNIESHMMLRRAGNASNALASSYFRIEAVRLRAAERATAQRFAAHFTCSELDSERLRVIVPDVNAIVIPNGVDCEFFTPRGVEPRPDSLAFVGTMNWYPNLAAMVFFLREVWPALKQRRPALTLDIVGSNPPASLLQLAATLPGVTVHGYVPDVRPFMERAAVFVCPIRDGGGTKLKILDAFAMRKCMVAHPVACEGIDVTPGRDVVLASTAQEFTEQVLTLLDDAPRRRALGEHARQLVEQHYSFQAIGQQFSAAMQALTEPPRAHDISAR